MNIRQATNADAETVADIIRESFAEPARVMSLDRERFPDYAAYETEDVVLARLAHGAEIFLLFDGAAAVGTVHILLTADGKRGEVGRLAVSPGHRKKGGGELLLRHAESRLRELGAEYAYLALIKPFTRLNAFYTANGYELIEDKTFPGLHFEVRFLEKKL